jgi:hypothetical protein
MRKSLVSIVALGLFAGAPVMAQTTTGETATGEATAAQTTMAQYQQQTTTLDAEQMQELLAEFEERSEIEGRLARAMTAEGNQVLVFVGPQNLEADESVAAEDSDIRDRFEEAGFTSVEILDDARIARAEFDDDHYIFALSADQIMRFGTQTGAVTGDPGEMDQTELGVDDTQTGTQTGTDMGQADTQTQTQLGQTDTDTTTQMGDTQLDMEPDTGTTTDQLGQTDTEMDTQLGQTDTHTDTQLGQTDTEMGQTGTEMDTQVGDADIGAETGQIGRALSEPDADRIVSSMGDAGFEDAAEFHGRLFRAISEDGAPVFFLITSRDMESDAEVNVSDVDVRDKLEGANLEQIQSIDNIRIVRGSLEDDHVFVLAGDLTPMGQ